MGDGTVIGTNGAAKEATHHWILQRYTALGNLVLVPWLLASLVLLPNYQLETITGWLSGTAATTAMALLIVSVFYHARLGLQVLIEDYVKDSGNRFGALALINLLAMAGAAYGLVSLFKISFGA